MPALRTSVERGSVSLLVVTEGRGACATTRASRRTSSRGAATAGTDSETAGGRAAGCRGSIAWTGVATASSARSAGSGSGSRIESAIRAPPAVAAPPTNAPSNIHFAIPEAARALPLAEPARAVAAGAAVAGAAAAALAASAPVPALSVAIRRACAPAGGRTDRATRKSRPESWPSRADTRRSSSLIALSRGAGRV